LPGPKPPDSEADLQSAAGEFIVAPRPALALVSSVDMKRQRAGDHPGNMRPALPGGWPICSRIVELSEQET